LLVGNRWAMRKWRRGERRERRERRRMNERVVEFANT
jgi:hypothetical protein